MEFCLGSCKNPTTKVTRVQLWGSPGAKRFWSTVKPKTVISVYLNHI